MGRVDAQDPRSVGDRHTAAGVGKAPITEGPEPAISSEDLTGPGTPPDGAPRRAGRRTFPFRAVAAAVLAAAVVWYLFILDTAADNDVVGGFRTLVEGIGELPGMVTDTAAFSSWWTYMGQQEGWGNIFENVLEHVQLVATSMFFAVLVSVAAGVLVHRVPVLRAPVLGVASVLLTIPSLALFAIFISVPGIGIGDRGPIIALSLYSILPILRNTVTGLEQVDRSILESAKGVGLSAWQRLVRIELPLAWPVILTGIRVATLLNIGIAAIAPLVGGSGLGGYVRDGLQRFPDITAVERMWTGVVWTVALALVIDLVFALVGRLTTSKGLRT